PEHEQMVDNLVVWGKVLCHVTLPSITITISTARRHRGPLSSPSALVPYKSGTKEWNHRSLLVFLLA
ncbi:hypothetical protein J6590_043238, partial [Homalodisca vitripennis]